jgi:hypothetical protein
MRWSRFGFIALLICLISGVAAASSFSFTGTFVQDDQMQSFLFMAPSSTVLLRTWGYAGGVNAAGDKIAEGGFDPVLSLFDVTGGLPAGPLIDQNNDGAGVAIDPVTGNASDSLLSETTLDPTHVYLLVLTQYDNTANGPTYGDGFSRTGQGNFTSGAFGCGGTAPFCDSSTIYRTGLWAVDITGVASASAVGVPEPASVLSLGLGVAGLALLKYRRLARRRA